MSPSISGCDHCIVSTWQETCRSIGNDRRDEGEGGLTRVEEVHVLPAGLVVASAKQPCDVVHQSDGVRAHVVHGERAVDGRT